MRVRIGPQYHAGQGDGGAERIRRQDSPDFAVPRGRGQAASRAGCTTGTGPSQSGVVFFKEGVHQKRTHPVQVCHAVAWRQSLVDTYLIRFCL